MSKSSSICSTSLGTINHVIRIHLISLSYIVVFVISFCFYGANVHVNNMMIVWFTVVIT